MEQRAFWLTTGVDDSPVWSEKVRKPTVTIATNQCGIPISLHDSRNFEFTSVQTGIGNSVSALHLIGRLKIMAYLESIIFERVTVGIPALRQKEETSMMKFCRLVQ